MSLSYSTAPEDAIVYTNSGETRIHPHPSKVLQLWEAPVRRTTTVASTLVDGRGHFAGIGVKFSSDSEDTRLLRGEILVESAWHIYLPERGTLFIEQSENYWGYLREIVIPAFWSSADNWKGNWHGTLTTGPGALGTSRVVGGSGEFAELVTEGVETVNAQAYSVERGPVAIDGQLTIDVSQHAETATAEANSGL